MQLLLTSHTRSVLVFVATLCIPYVGGSLQIETGGHGLGSLRPSSSSDPGLSSQLQVQAGLRAQLAGVESGLAKGGWTMLVGDSVLYEEFLALTKVLLEPTCIGTLPKELATEHWSPISFFAGATIEYLVVCRRAGKGTNATRNCEMIHQPCLHLTVPEPCPNAALDPFCDHVNHRFCDLKEWRNLADTATSPGVEFALSFHWAPGPALARQDPNIGNLDPTDPGVLSGGADEKLLTERFSYKSPSTIIMNNCLHSWPYSWTLPPDRWRVRLMLFQKVLRENLRALAAAGFHGSLVYQGCLPLSCNERFAWKGWSRDGSNCGQQNSELQVVNVGVRRLLKALGLEDAYFDSWELAASRPDAYLDGVHPCWTRPCLWEPGSPMPHGAAVTTWSGWLDTDPSLCVGLMATAWARLAVGVGGALLPSAAVIASVALPDISDLHPDLFVGKTRTGMVAPTLSEPSEPGVVRPHVVTPSRLTVAASQGASTQVQGTDSPVEGTAAPVIAVQGGTDSPVAGTASPGQFLPADGAAVIAVQGGTDSPVVGTASPGQFLPADGTAIDQDSAAGALGTSSPMQMQGTASPQATALPAAAQSLQGRRSFVPVNSRRGGLATPVVETESAWPSVWWFLTFGVLIAVAFELYTSESGKKSSRSRTDIKGAGAGLLAAGFTAGSGLADGLGAAAQAAGAAAGAAAVKESPKSFQIANVVERGADAVEAEEVPVVLPDEMEEDSFSSEAVPPRQQFAVEPKDS